jgi:hydroxymethylbilane synthase
MKKTMSHLLPRDEIRLGTRASLLALCQANWVKSKLEEHHPGIRVKLVHIKTTGDKLDVPLFEMGGKGLFVKEIEEALLRSTVDMAVHSAKDLPALIPEGLALMAFPEREDPRDVLISREGKRFSEIPPGGRVGTGSLRRRAQLLHLRPGLEIIPMRGNLDTRIKKLSTLKLDAVVLASAGLRRLKWEEQISEYFEPEVLLPAIGQGVLAIEGRLRDERIKRLVAPLNHYPTEAALAAERAFLRVLEGGCQVPIAGLAKVESGRLSMAGLVAEVEGGRVIRGRVEGPAVKSEELGRELAEGLLAQGAGDILREVYRRQ